MRVGVDERPEMKMFSSFDLFFLTSTPSPLFFLSLHSPSLLSTPSAQRKTPLPGKIIENKRTSNLIKNSRLLISALLSLPLSLLLVGVVLVSIYISYRGILKKGECFVSFSTVQSFICSDTGTGEIAAVAVVHFCFRFRPSGRRWSPPLPPQPRSRSRRSHFRRSRSWSS